MTTAAVDRDIFFEKVILDRFLFEINSVGVLPRAVLL